MMKCSKQNLKETNTKKYYSKRIFHAFRTIFHELNYPSGFFSFEIYSVEYYGNLIGQMTALRRAAQ